MKQRPAAEQIVAKLREAEVELAKGRRTSDVTRKLGITDPRPMGARHEATSTAYNR